MKRKFYAVKRGRELGIFDSWEKCKISIEKYKGALYKSFDNIDDAKKYMSNIDENINDDSVSCLEDLETIQDKLNTNELYWFSDGSINLKEKKIGFGAVAISKNKIVRIGGICTNSLLFKYRNITGELLGAALGIEFAELEGFSSITIFHDYQGVSEWVNGSWKADDLLSKSYKAYMNNTNIDINFVKVKGHANIKFNEEADIVSKMACGVCTKNTLEASFIKNTEFLKYLINNI